MEQQSRDAILIGNKKVSMHGKFRLTCNKPANKLFLTNINADIPQGKTINEKDYFYDVNGPINFLLIQKTETFFNPDYNDVDALNVAALIRHKNVRLEDMSEAEHMALAKKGLKKENPEFSILNLDKSVMDKHNESVEMIEIKYLITKKKEPLTKRKLMYITSALGLSTNSEIQDEVRYTAYLQKQLIDFLESNKAKREQFMLYYEKIAEAEIIYFINQFIEHDIVKDFGGMYKIQDKPVGFSIQNVKEWFQSNEDEYNVYKMQINEFNSDKVTK